MLVLLYSFRSVPVSTFGDLVRSLRGGQPVWSRSSPPSSLPELRKPSSIEKRPFRRGSCRPFLTFPVSADDNGISGGFFASRLCIQKIHSQPLNFTTELNSLTGDSVSCEAHVRKPPELNAR